MATLGHGHLFKAHVSLKPDQFQSVSDAFSFTPPLTTTRCIDAAQIPVSPDIWTTTQHLRLDAIRHCKRLLSIYQHEFLVLEISTASPL